MDRDNRWDRVKKAYDAITGVSDVTAQDPVTAVAQAYEKGETDEFVSPTVIVNNGKPVGTVKDEVLRRLTDDSSSR